MFGIDFLWDLIFSNYEGNYQINQKHSFHICNTNFPLKICQINNHPPATPSKTSNNPQHQHNSTRAHPAHQTTKNNPPRKTSSQK